MNYCTMILSSLVRNLWMLENFTQIVIFTHGLCNSSAFFIYIYIYTSGMDWSCQLWIICSSCFRFAYKLSPKPIYLIIYLLLSKQNIFSYHFPIKWKKKIIYRFHSLWLGSKLLQSALVTVTHYLKIRKSSDPRMFLL